VSDFEQKGYVFIATQNGVIKKTDLSAFSKPRKGGIIAVNIKEDDRLIEAKLSTGEGDIILVTHHGRSIRFHESQVRAMGRNTTGVRGIKLKGKDFVIAMLTMRDHKHVFTISEKGYGKRTSVEDFRLQNRSGSGIIAMKVTEKTGELSGALGVVENEDIIIITQNGVVNRQNISSISVIGRNTQGVRVIRLDENDRVSDIAKIIQTDIEEENSTE